MTRQVLRFLLLPADQTRIEGATILVESGPPDYPDLMHVRFQVTDPEKGAPRLTPVFPGTMRFLADPGGVLPAPTDSFTWTDEQYNSWQTQGTLLLALEPKLAKDVQGLVPRPPMLPTRAWYWPVKLPRDFLFETIRNRKGLKHAAVQKLPSGRVLTAATEWPNHAVSGFLHGRYMPILRQDASDPAKDDVALPPALPTVVMAPDGWVDLLVALAHVPTRLDDGEEASLSAVAGALADHDIQHPRNGALHVRESLKVLQPHLLGGESANALAAAVFADWPAAPRYFRVQFPFVGSHRLVLHSGGLAEQSMRLEDSVGTTTIQDRRLPLHGQVTYEQPPPPVGTPAPPPPQLTLSFATGTLRVTATDPVLTEPSPGQWLLDFSHAQAPVVTLAPPDPGPAPAARAAYADRLAKAVHGFTKAGAIQTLTQQTLVQYEADIRPPGWPPTGLWTPVPPDGSPSDVFVGARKPWNYVSQARMSGLFAGIDRVEVSGANAPPVRPAEAVMLCVMEGLLATVSAGMVSRTWKTLGIDPPTHEGINFTEPELAGASPSRIRTILRVRNLWSFWGLDDLNHHTSTGDNFPPLNSPLPGAVSLHDTALTAALARLTSAGITVPSLVEINEAIDVRRDTLGGKVRWSFRPAPSYLAIHAWIQYAELLRRQAMLATRLGTPDVWDYPAFGYMAFNGGVSPPGRPLDIDPNKPVFLSWNEARDRIANDSACAGKSEEEALRCWDVTDGETKRMIDRAAFGAFSRRFVARINGVQFSALFHSYGKVFPRVL